MSVNTLSQTERASIEQSETADEALAIIERGNWRDNNNDYGGSRLEHKLVGREWFQIGDDGEKNLTKDKQDKNDDGLQDHLKIIDDLINKGFSIVLTESSKVKAGSETAKADYGEKIYAAIYILKGEKIEIKTFEGTEKEFKEQFAEEQWMQDLMDDDDDKAATSSNGTVNPIADINSTLNFKELNLKEEKIETSAWEDFWKNLLKLKNEKENVGHQQKGLLELFGIAENNAEKNESNYEIKPESEHINLLSLFAPGQVEHNPQAASEPVSIEEVTAELVRLQIGVKETANFTQEMIKESNLNQANNMQPAIVLLEPTMQEVAFYAEPVKIASRIVDAEKRQDFSHGIILEFAKTVKEPISQVKNRQTRASDKKTPVKAGFKKEEVNVYAGQELHSDVTEDQNPVLQLKDKLPVKSISQRAMKLVIKEPSHEPESYHADKTPDKLEDKAVLPIKAPVQAFKPNIKNAPLKSPEVHVDTVKAKAEDLDNAFSERTAITEVGQELNDDLLIVEQPLEPAVSTAENDTPESVLVTATAEAAEPIIIIQAPELEQKQESGETQKEPSALQAEPLQTQSPQKEEISEVKTLNHVEETREVIQGIVQKDSVQPSVPLRIPSQPIQSQIEQPTTPASKANELIQSENSAQVNPEPVNRQKVAIKTVGPHPEAIYIEQPEDNANTIEAIDAAEETPTVVLEAKTLEVPLLYKELELPAEEELEADLEQSTQQAPKQEVVKPIVKKIEVPKVLDVKPTAPKIQVRQKEPIVKLRDQLHALSKVLGKERTPQKITAKKDQKIEAGKNTTLIANKEYKATAVKNQLTRMIYKDHEAASVHQVLQALENLKNTTPTTLTMPIVRAENTSLRRQAFEAQNITSSQNSFARKVIQPTILRKASYALETTINKQGGNNLTAYTADDEDLINSQSQSEIIKLAA